jgi:hypothetical protein
VVRCKNVHETVDPCSPRLFYKALQMHIPIGDRVTHGQFSHSSFGLKKKFTCMICSSPASSNLLQAYLHLFVVSKNKSIHDGVTYIFLAPAQHICLFRLTHDSFCFSFQDGIQWCLYYHLKISMHQITCMKDRSVNHR